MTNIPITRQISSDGNNAGASPLPFKNMALGEAAHTAAGADSASRSTTHIDPAAKTAPAAPTQAYGTETLGPQTQLHRLPQELQERPQWCVASPEKAPLVAIAGLPYAKVNAPSTWQSFETTTAIARGQKLHIGYVLAKDDPYTCIDLDVCNRETQQLKKQPHDPSKWTTAEELARYEAIIKAFDSYTEVSTLGWGVHIWVRGRIGTGVRRGGVEVYSQERFIICTGNVFIDKPIAERQELLDNMVSTMQLRKAHAEPLPDQPQTESDEKILLLAKTASNGEKVEALCRCTSDDEITGKSGSYESLGYPSQSEADYALLSHIAFYSPNNTQCKRIFRNTGLGQRKKATKDDRYLDDSLKKLRTDQAVKSSFDDEAIRNGRKIAEALLQKFDEKHLKRFRLRSADEISSRPPLPWRVQGLLPEQGFAALYGPPGSGKSFLILDMLAAICEGRDWFGHRVIRAPVVYAALEGQAGLTQRVKAYQLRHGKMNGVNFLEDPIDIRNPEDRSDLILAIKQAGIAGGVLCIDTLAASAPGMDENASTDMGAVIRYLQDIQVALGGCVIVVHHTGKDDSKGLRGWSGLLGALDVSIEVSNVRGLRKWKVAKSKDGSDGMETGFALDTVTLGTDNFGDEITSCVVVPPVRFAPSLANATLTNNAKRDEEDDEFIFGWIKRKVAEGDYPSINSLKHQQAAMNPERHLTHARITDAVHRLIAVNQLVNDKENSPFSNTWIRPNEIEQSKDE